MRMWMIGAAALAMATGAHAAQQEGDAYTRYELLPPGSAKFHIVYDVTVFTPGATRFFNPIRPGSVSTDETVVDKATGKPLAFQVVDGAAARAEGLDGAKPGEQYIRVTLARPVPADGGQGRIRIEKTYEDAKSYFVQGDEIVFKRGLGIKRNAVVLPQGWELVSCNTPSQVIQQPDGRILVSFWNSTAAEAPLELHARRTLGAAASAPAAGAADKAPERAAQTRDIVYFLKPPETHAFELYHDYTETRPGVSDYVNVVREGSTVSSPSGRNLDTGEPLRVEVLTGAAIAKAGLHEPGLEHPGPRSQAVVFRFPAVKPGESARLRMTETYADADRYKLVGDELVWHRTLGRAANAVVLPAGWALTHVSVPATVSGLPDGRVRLDLINPAPGDLDVLITARRR